MMKVALILALVGLALSQTPPTRPVVSDTFEARINVEFTNNTHHLTGRGDQAVNYTSNQAVFRAQFDSTPRFEIYELFRYDLGITYELDSGNWSICRSRNVSGHITADWAWLVNATYGGQFSIRGELFNWWNTSTTVQGIYFTFGAAFRTTGPPNIPAFFSSKWQYQNNAEERFVGFESFQPYVASPSFFDIPKICTA